MFKYRIDRLVQDRENRVSKECCLIKTEIVCLRRIIRLDTQQAMVIIKVDVSGEVPIILVVKERGSDFILSIRC